MKTACILVRRGGHQPTWGTAFAEGLRRHGWRAKLTAAFEPSDMLVTWGVRRTAAMAAQRGEICILERGYLGDRLHWTSVSFGAGLNGRAEFRGLSDDPERFDRHFRLAPWRRVEGPALLIGQVPGDMSLRPVGGDLAKWYAETAAALRALGHEVVFRPHPEAVKRGLVSRPEGVRMSGGPLAAALESAGLVVTFNSNTAVDAVVAGVPAVAMDRGSMAWPVVSHVLSDAPETPDREAWSAMLAWCQWSEAEMRSGECWEAVCSN